MRGVDGGLPTPATLRRRCTRWIEAMERIRTWVEVSGRAVAELELNPLVWSPPTPAGCRWTPAAAGAAGSGRFG